MPQNLATAADLLASQRDQMESMVTKEQVRNDRRIWPIDCCNAYCYCLLKQVQEMEGLFMATVTRLSERVIQLEKTKSSGWDSDVNMDDELDQDADRIPPKEPSRRIEPGGRIRSMHSSQQQQQQGAMLQSSSSNSILFGVGGKKIIR